MDRCVSIELRARSFDDVRVERSVGTVAVALGRDGSTGGTPARCGIESGAVEVPVPKYIPVATANTPILKQVVETTSNGSREIFLYFAIVIILYYGEMEISFAVGALAHSRRAPRT